MKLFTRLFFELDRTNKTSEKVSAIERYFRAAPPADAAWGLFFLAGQRLTRIVKTSVIRDAALRASGLPDWMLGECYEAVGDFSETIALVLPSPSSERDEALHDVVERRIEPLVHAPDDRARAMLLDAWAGLDQPTAFMFNKLIRGNLRVGVQRPLVLRALAQATGIDAATLAHRFSGGFKPGAASFEALVAVGDGPDDAARPYPFCLAHQLDLPLAALGEPRDWQMEFKWDGIRAQILRRDGLPQGVQIWSRGEEPIAGTFPEIAAAARSLPPGTVLDGEVLAWRHDRPGIPGHPLSFNALQARLNRKDVQPGLFSAEGVTFAAFDLLEHRGSDIRALPLRERRRLLEELFATVARDGLLRLSPALSVATWDQAEATRRLARDRYRAEGVMLKHLGSRYHIGRVAGGRAQAPDGGLEAGWWKWKVDPYSVDAVLIYAQQGSGRRAGLFTDYTFGVWDPDASGELTPFAKAYSGLTNGEIDRVDAYIRANTLDRAGPVRMIRPELVFEISFEGIQESARHRSGVAVRFPRISRWRTDKPARDADTIGTIRALLAATRARDDGSPPHPPATHP